MAGILVRAKMTLPLLSLRTVRIMGLTLTGALPLGLAESSLEEPLEEDVVEWPMTIAITVDVALPEMATEAVLAFIVATMLSGSIAVTPSPVDPQANPREVEEGPISVARAWAVLGPSIMQEGPIAMIRLSPEELASVALASEPGTSTIAIPAAVAIEL